MNANQLVAHNLGRLRRDRNLTQEQAAAQIWPWRGEKWSKASFSIAERYALEGPSRRREFDANDILALALAFEVPISELFQLPDGTDEVAAGDDARNRISRRRLEEATSPRTDYVVKQHVASLRQIADDLEKESSNA